VTADKKSDLDVTFSEKESDDFPERIKELISRAGNVSKLSRLCGSSESVIRKWRSGDAEPSRSRLLALADSMSVSIEWLVAGRGPIEPQSQQPQEPAPQAPALGQSGDGSLAKTDKELLQRIMLGIEEGLEATGRKVPADKKVELAFALYEIFSKSEAAPDTATILPFLKLA